MNIKIKAFPEIGNAANCYCIQSDNDIALCDIGFAGADILDYVKKNSSNIRYILLTHCHFDHICGVGEVLKYCNPEIVISSEDAEGLWNPELSLCSMFGKAQPSLKPDIIVNDNDALPFGNGTIKVLHTPGHTAGSVCFAVGNILLSGDTLFAGGIGRTDFPSGSAEDIFNSLKRLALLKESFTVYPGHGPKTDLEYEVQNNPYFNTAL